MAVITRPTSLAIDAQGCYWGLQRYDIEESSDMDGTEAARPMAPPRWLHGLTSGNYLTQSQWGDWVTMLMQLRGKVNTIGLYDPMQKAPAGTMRGTLTLSGAHSAGATTVTVTGGAGQAGTTLLRGDRIGIGAGYGTSQVVMVMADATANGSGVITLTVEPSLRIAFSSGAGVTWDKPLVYFKLQSTQNRWTYNQALGANKGGFSADFKESFGP